MHPKIKDVIDKKTSEISKVLLTEDDLIFVEKLLPKSSVWLDEDVNVSVAVRGKQEVKDILRMFAENGVLIDTFVPSDIQPVWWLRGKKVKIILTPIWDTNTDNGALCRLVKTGEETHTRPIYKLVCDDNGQEVPDAKED